MHEKNRFGAKSLLAMGWVTLLTARMAFAAEPIDSGTIVGRVLEKATGKSLTGALVRVVETGEQVATDDAGNFRFLDVPAGEYTLSIMYVGYADKMWRVKTDAAGETPAEFALEQSAWDLVEVTVFGTRSARANALSRQRAADNSSFVISADTLGNFTGTTVSEALRRVPGVAFQRDPLTGDGTNVILRGLEPRMNLVTLNGLTLPVGNGTDRAASLNNLLADSVDTVTVHHTLLPSMESAGSGGLVEIETKSPLQRAPRFVSFGVESGRSIEGNFLDDLLATGTVSGIFGAEGNVGLSASAEYRKRDVRSVQYDAGAEPALFLPLERDGSLNILSRAEVDPFQKFPFEPGADQFYVQTLRVNSRRGETSDLVATVTGDWRPTERFGLRLDLIRAQSDTTAFDRDSGASQGTTRAPTPIAALNGEVRQMLYWDGLLTLTNTSGVTEAKTITDTASLRGDWSHGRWQHRFTAGVAEGSSEFGTFSLATGDPSFGPIAIDPAYVLPEAVDPAQGQVVSVFGQRAGRGIQLPLLNRAGWDFLNNPENQFFQNASRGAGRGSNSRYTGEWGSRHSFGGPHLKYVEAGAYFESSRFTNRNRIFFLNPTEWPVTAADLGLTFSDPGFAAVGVDELGFMVMSRNALEALRGRVAAAQSGGSGGIVESELQLDPRLQRASTQENDLATYLQAQVDFGRLEIVGGARLARVDVNAFNLRQHRVIRQDGSLDEEFAQRFTRLVDESGVSTDVLPRVGFNFRYRENLVFRGSYNLAVARPDIAMLSTDEEFALDLSGLNELPFGTERLAISQGNPDLDPAITHSFDISMERYSSDIGLLRIGAFYKQIDNLLQLNFTGAREEDLREMDLPDDPYFNELLADPERLAALMVRVSKPTNSPDPARIWGIDLHLERQFSFLPGIWSGFGIFTNLTFTKSSKRQNYAWFLSPVYDPDGNFVSRELRQLVVPSMTFDQQPKFSGTFAVTYNQYDIDATLAWSAQSRRKNSFQANGLGYFAEQDSSLDFRIERRLTLGGRAQQVYLEGTDLLRGTDDPDMLTSYGDGGSGGQVYGAGSYFGGRQFRIGVRANF
jgi:TonB-dependent receptor